MIKILFVCHGNICRSPMAEFLLKDKVHRLGISEDFYIASAATSTEEIGNPVHYGTKRILDRLGISCSGKTARRMTKQDYVEYDLLIGMDSANIRNMSRIAGGDPEGRIHRLLDFTPLCRDVADPWYTGDFEKTLADITEGIDGLLDYLHTKNPRKSKKSLDKGKQTWYNK